VPLFADTLLVCAYEKEIEMAEKNDEGDEPDVVETSSWWWCAERTDHLSRYPFACVSAEVRICTSAVVARQRKHKKK